jgi:hypothetical protein
MEKVLASVLVISLLVVGIILGVKKGEPITKLPKIKGIVVVVVKN